MKGLKTIRTLLRGKPSGRPRAAKPKKKHRPLKAVLSGALIGWLLDLLEGRWKNDLWRPKG